MSSSSGIGGPGPAMVGGMPHHAALQPQSGMRTTPVRRNPEVDMNQVDPETRKAAQGMESMFLEYLMQTMRKTVPKSEMSQLGTTR